MGKSILRIMIILITFTIFSCTKYKDVTPEVAGIISIKVSADWMNGGLELEKYYALNSNDSIRVSSFRFYISNIKIKNTNTGKWFSVPDSYYLFDQANANTDLNTFSLKNIPAGQYSEISFYTGVDSIANSNEVIAGSIPALSQTNNMFWAWNTGYVFYKLEGKFKNASQGADKGSFIYHIGSNANLSKQHFVLSKPVTQNGIILIQADAAKIFSGNTIDVNVTNNVMMGPTTTKLMQNYAKMYSIEVTKY